MIWPLSHLLEVLQVSRADRAAPAPKPLPAELHAQLLAAAALEVAIGQLGRGESGGNNLGPDVARYIAPTKPPANWCAGFVGWCYEEAARKVGVPLPFKRSLGAKRLGENIAAVGRRFTEAQHALPGDVMVFHRGAQGSWMGHVGFVERNRGDGFIDTIEGNSGPKVVRGVRLVGSARDRFAFFASLRR
jgi:hypothetical protein